MKLCKRSPERLEFRHRPVGVAIVLGLLILFGVSAGIISLNMAERPGFEDDFVRIGIALIVGSLLVGGTVFWFAVRVRSLVLDAGNDVVILRSRGLGVAKEARRPLRELSSVEHRSEGRTDYRNDFTVLVWNDGYVERLLKMDPPTRAAIRKNVKIIREWMDEAHPSAGNEN